MTQRLFASDIDGTLLRSDQSVSDRNIAAIRSATTSGHSFLLVTGRPIRWMPPIIDQIGEQALAICANGSIIYEPTNGTIIRSHPIKANVLAQAIATLGIFDSEVVFGAEGVDGFAIEHRFWNRWPLPTDVLRTTRDRLSDHESVKLVARSRSHHPAELAGVLLASMGDELAVTWGGDEDGDLLEVHAHGVNKSTALAEVAQWWGFDPADVVAFGDMPNDVEMIDWAGHGVAVANAHDRIKAVADEITESNEDDGVAIIIERMIKN